MSLVIVKSEGGRRYPFAVYLLVLALHYNECISSSSVLPLKGMGQYPRFRCQLFLPGCYITHRRGVRPVWWVTTMPVLPCTPAPPQAAPAVPSAFLARDRLKLQSAWCTRWTKRLMIAIRNSHQGEDYCEEEIALLNMNLVGKIWLRRPVRKQMVAILL